MAVTTRVDRTKMACQGQLPEAFEIRRLPGETLADRDARIARAKQLCSVCSQRQPCLADAIQRNDRNMVMGEMTPAERDNLVASSGN